MNRTLEGNDIVLRYGVREICRITTKNGWEKADKVASLLMIFLSEKIADVI